MGGLIRGLIRDEGQAAVGTLFVFRRHSVAAGRARIFPGFMRSGCLRDRGQIVLLMFRYNLFGSFKISHLHENSFTD